MPKVKVQSQTQIGAKDAFDKICNLLNNDKELRKLDPSYKCEFDAQSLTGQAKGSQFKAEMQVLESAGGSQVELVIDLPFHLTLVKGLVEKTLKKKMEEVLG